VIVTFAVRVPLTPSSASAPVVCTSTDEPIDPKSIVRA
jgi:hypothetical protein